MRTRPCGAALAVVLAVGALGCNSGAGLRSYPFGGQWDGQGVLAGYDVTVTQSGGQIPTYDFGFSIAGHFQNKNTVVANSSDGSGGAVTLRRQ
jgi:hypothetical protein